MDEKDLQQLSLFSDEELDSLLVVWPVEPLTVVPQIVQLALPFDDDSDDEETKDKL